jgi:hypothetical protein
MNPEGKDVRALEADIIKQEFTAAVKAANIPASEAQIEALISGLQDRINLSLYDATVKSHGYDTGWNKLEAHAS